jgi:hypothetical protein
MMETSTLTWLKQILRRQELMDRVMEKCGVDVLAAIREDNGQAFFQARAKCRECLYDLACRGWSLESSEELQLPPDFCANTDFFHACSREDHPLSSKLPSRAAEVTCVGTSRPLNVPFEQRASSELVKLIWKLRWIGEKKEAAEAERQLARLQARMQVLRIPYPCSALGMLHDTD